MNILNTLLITYFQQILPMQFIVQVCDTLSEENAIQGFISSVFRGEISMLIAENSNKRLGAI